MTKQVYSFEHTIEATKDTRGFWVSNHREIVKPYLVKQAEKISWTKVLAGLEDTESEIYKVTEKLIDIVDTKENEALGTSSRWWETHDLSRFIKEAYEEMGL
nr:MAG TPA: hypothetical protein [Caudoviricetes sp.]